MKTASFEFKLQMAVLCLAYVTVGALTTSAQSTIDFRNTAGTAISTNDLAGHSGLISGAGNYLFGLYMGPFGSNPDALLLSGLTANGSTAGLFGTAGNPVPIGFPVGSQVSFQVRGWSGFAGSSYESALAYATGGNLPLAYLGTSTPGSFTVPASGSVIIFGSGPGQVRGFELTPIPEPSAAMLGVLGLGLLGLCARARKAWSNPKGSFERSGPRM
jgi:hypothetical protein